MSPSNAEPTRVVAHPSDSILMTLARAALAPDATGVSGHWPMLDLNDARQREFGDYELLEEIGRGGMGVVYRARQRSLDRDVAIKFIASGLADSFNVARFLGEARAAARLLHPNIVPVHEVGSIEGVHYFSMPLIKGKTLAVLLEEGRIETRFLIALMLKVCAAIDYAHRLGLLHLDLKPANVLLDENNEPLITDFGLARHMDARGGVDAQEVSGTPSFMAPEQILIRQYRLSVATDVYALGAVLYRCLAHVSPHGEGAPDELIRRAAAGRVRPPRELEPSIAPDLAAICMHCLELHPDQRYQSVAELSDDIRRVRDGLPVSVRAIGRVERAQRWVRREPKFAAALAGVAMALFVGVLATLWQWRAAALAQQLAEQQRDRANVAMELGAFLFANSQRAEDAHKIANADLERLSAGLIAKLRERLPADEDAQADTLSALVRLLDEYDQYYAEQLLGAIAIELGVDYRKEVIAALLRGKDPHRYLHASLLAWSNEFRDTEPRQLRKLVADALIFGADDPAVLRTVAIYCPERIAAPACLAPDSGRRLTELEPENLYHWFLRFVQTDPGPGQWPILQEAAKRTQFDDHQIDTHIAHRKVMLASDVKAPALLARPWALLSLRESPEELIAGVTASSIPQSARRRFNDYCNPAKNTALHGEARSACLQVALSMARSQASVHSRMIGVWVARGLVARGSAIDIEMRELRRKWIYISETMATLPKIEQFAMDAELSELGEMAAFAQVLKRHGLPASPPDHWQAKNPALITMTEPQPATPHEEPGVAAKPE